MADSKQFKLIQRLFDLTNKGDINWVPAGDDETFVATLGQYGVVIGKHSGWSVGGTITIGGEPAIFLRLLNSDGEPIDVIQAADLTHPSEQHTAAVRLKEIFNSARRKAKGADKVIEGILAELDKREKVR